MTFCECGSGDKYENCCIDGDKFFTDKFCILWCCKDMANKCIKDWNVTALIENELGKRYFTKIESKDKDLTKLLSSALTSGEFIYDDGHFGTVLEEDGPMCGSKFVKDCKKCDNGECNHPNLTIYNKYLCALMTCVHCKDPQCVSKLECDKVIKAIMSVRKMIKNANDTVLKDALKAFFEGRFAELVKSNNLKNNLPYYLIN